MIEITRDNYELYAIDYVEGNLPMDIQIQFEVFLSNNPDISKELNDLPDFIADNSIHLSTKDNLSLKKGGMLSEDINFENCDFYFTAYHEGDLSLVEQELVHNFLKTNPEKEADFKQIALLNYSSNSPVSFPLKASLKKVVPLSSFQLFFRIAAVFVLLFGLAYIFLLPNNETQVYTQRDSKVEFPTVKEEPIQITIKKENLSPTKKEEIQLAISPIKPPPVEKKEEVEVVNEDLRLAENSEDKGVEDEIIIVLEEKPKKEEEIIVSNEVAPKSIKEDDSKSILKFKRPRKKKQNKEDELLASTDNINDTETILKITNPLKNKKNISFGPIKIKRQ